MFYKTTLKLSALCLSLLAPNAAQAAIIKCIGVDGTVTYKQTSCPVEDKVQEVVKNISTNSDTYDCKIANNFARRTAMSMRAGETSGDIFDYYGGIDAMPRTSVGVVNYVYSHLGNKDTGAQRIAALSAARCSGGAYGSVSCEDFPYGFIAELGGCEAAARSTIGSKQNQMLSEQELFQENGSMAAMGARTTARGNTGDINCKNKVHEELAELMEQMRSSGQSASSQDNMQQERRGLMAKLRLCN